MENELLSNSCLPSFLKQEQVSLTENFRWESSRDSRSQVEPKVDFWPTASLRSVTANHPTHVNVSEQLVPPLEWPYRSFFMCLLGVRRLISVLSFCTVKTESVQDVISWMFARRSCDLRTNKAYVGIKYIKNHKDLGSHFRIFSKLASNSLSLTIRYRTQPLR